MLHCPLCWTFWNSFADLHRLWPLELKSTFSKKTLSIFMFLSMCITFYGHYNFRNFVKISSNLSLKIKGRKISSSLLMSKFGKTKSRNRQGFCENLKKRFCSSSWISLYKDGDLWLNEQNMEILKLFHENCKYFTNIK